jgi:hypothetical protein
VRIDGHESASLRARRLSGAPGTRAASAAIGAVDVKPDVVRRHTAAISASGSTTPVLTVSGGADDQERQVAVAPIGDDLRSSAATSIRCSRRRESSESHRCRVRTCRRPSDPRVRFRRARRRAAARRPPAAPAPGPRALSPRARQEADEVRHVAAADEQPAPSAGNPISSAIQRTVCASISVAIGDRRHAPTFWLTPDASRSPSAPIGAGLDVM